MSLVPRLRASRDAGADVTHRPPPGAVDRAGRADRAAQARRVVTTFSKPKWLTVHLLVWAAAVAMVLLGRWQLDVSNEKHFNLQNFGYALQWWAFTAFAIFMWLRIMRDHLRRDDAVPTTGGTVALRTEQDRNVHAGAAWLVTPADKPGDSPTIYRGYVMPSSATTPARSEGDEYHASYNDYLWQLSMADEASNAQSNEPVADDS